LIKQWAINQQTKLLTQTNSLQARRIKKNINGILLLDKPKGLSSNQALQKAKHLYQAAKAGHTGTLDPMATGVLPICFGEATKFSQFLTDADKTYQATLQLGQTTTTGDAEGELLTTEPVNCTAAEFTKICANFVGKISQTPPMYSALKHNGKPLYEYARAGITVKRAARDITIHAIDIDDFEGDVAKITVSCSKGTYIRTLAEDIGEALGCGSHLIGLRRTKTDIFNIDNTHSLAGLQEMDASQQNALLLGIDQCVTALPAIEINALQVEKIQQGQNIEYTEQVQASVVKMYDEDGRFIGLAEPKAPDVLKPKRLVVYK